MNVVIVLKLIRLTSRYVVFHYLKVMLWFILYCISRFEVVLDYLFYLFFIFKKIFFKSYYDVFFKIIFT